MLVTPAIPFTVRLYRRIPPVATYAISGPARFLMIRSRSILMRQELEDIFDFSSKGGQCPSGAAKDSIISRSGATLAQMFCYLGRLLIGPEATTVASPATAEILVVYVQSCGIMKINRIRMVAFLVSNIFRAIFVICFHPLMQSIGSHLRRAAWHSLHRLSSPEHTSFTQYTTVRSRNPLDWNVLIFIVARSAAEEPSHQRCSHESSCYRCSLKLLPLRWR